MTSLPSKNLVSMWMVIDQPSVDIMLDVLLVVRFWKNVLARQSWTYDLQNKDKSPRPLKELFTSVNYLRCYDMLIC